MSRLIDTNAQDWLPVRPELTQGVSGKLLLDGTTRIVLTRVIPGGNFPLHRDDYGHLCHFLSGAGVVMVEEKRLVVGEGICLQIAAGELHGYENHGSEDLVLVSVNLAKE
jgi:quercetin dioxygenase-like cupin family protein